MSSGLLAMLYRGKAARCEMSSGRPAVSREQYCLSHSALYILKSIHIHYDELRDYETIWITLLHHYISY